MKLVLAYKNFAAHKHISHIGLGVAAINTAKVLRQHGIDTVVWDVTGAKDLRDRLRKTPACHVIISAPWIPVYDMQCLVIDHPNTEFSVVCHSNVGFLQADANGIRLVREAMDLEMGTHNFHLGGNSRRFCRWIESAFGSPCTYLPNLYYLDPRQSVSRPLYQGGTLRIGAFGATRALKNLLSSAGAALEISRHLKTDLELWLSAGRVEGGGDTVLNAARAMLGGLPGVKLMENGWQSWPSFRRVVGSMHLLMQPSYTESFNMVTADGIAEGVPSVVSNAIDWAPPHWRANVDDVFDIARVGRSLISDIRGARDGFEALNAFVEDGVTAYRKFLFG